MEILDDRFRVVRRWIGNSKCWLKAFLEAVPSIPSIVAVVVMGSVVRQRGHRRSDFDLLVLYRGKRPEIAAPLEVDIRMYPVEKADEHLAAGHEILGWAMKFGAPLYDPRDDWKVLQTRYAEHVPLPSATEAAKRGKQTLSRTREMLSAGDEAAADDLVLAALTQLVRQRLIEAGVFPASRPELPEQLRTIYPNDSLAQLLDDAMYGEFTPRDLLDRLDRAVTTDC